VTVEQVATGLVFKAEFSGGECGKCGESITKGDNIRYNSSSRPEHVDCAPDLAYVDAKDTVLWNVTGESLERYERSDAEEARVAPLQRPACPRCWMELPKSMVCGSC
jgi:hypothetical protein